MKGKLRFTINDVIKITTYYLWFSLKPILRGSLHSCYVQHCIIFSFIIILFKKFEKGRGTHILPLRIKQD